MSRMATMQVLNQSFRNLNDALNAYMRNRNDSRYMDLREQAQQLEAARNEDLDRRRLLLESARMSSEYSPEVGNAYRYAAGGDPIAQNLFMQGVGDALEQRETTAKANSVKIDPVSIFTMCIKNGMSAEESFDVMQKAERWFNGGGSDAASVISNLTGGTPAESNSGKVAATVFPNYLTGEAQYPYGKIAVAASENNPQQTETLSQREARLNQKEAETRAKYKPGTAAVINAARRLFPKTAGVDRKTPAQIYSPFGW